MSINKLYQGFLDVGCTPKEGIGPTGQAALSLELFRDYDLRVLPEDPTWKVNEITFYLYSPLYEQVMSVIVSSKEQLLEYSPRQYTGNDGSRGCLSMSHPLIETKKSSITFLNGGVTYLFKEFFRELSDMESPTDLFEKFYGDNLVAGYGSEETKMASFIRVSFERLWGYLYLACESSLGPQEILEHSQTEYMRNLIKTWRIKKPIDMNLLEGFQEAYRRE